ncbi:Tad domain-containing protein [Histidinibacterium lentulum]|uniref:Tad domain-containing protein n=1 Tax=Histidinibacterium lentulum TaxID=2480588 RepID=UPI00161AC62C|nr:Tad domain-containing protein [Histidinibacterium lentulum]
MTIFSLFIFVLMLMIGGLAVDVMRAEGRRIDLQAAMDSAVLAAADLDQIRNPRDVVLDYIDRAGFDADEVQVTVSESLNGREVSALAELTTGTYFMRLVGIETIQTALGSSARELISDVEISLVLDISGSMRDSGKMDNLKAAAQTFVRTTLRGDLATRTSINLVPYAGQTNPGPIAFDYLGGVRLPAGIPPGNHVPTWPQAISNIVLYYDTNGDGSIDAAFKVEGFPQNAPRDADQFLGSLDAALRSDYPALAAATVVGVSVKGGKATTAFYRIQDNPNGPAADAGPTDNTGPLSQYATSAERSYNSIDWSAAPLPPAAPSSCIEIARSEFNSAGLPDADTHAQVPHFMYWDIAANVMDWGWCPEDDTAIQYAQNDEDALTSFIRNIRMHDGTGTHYAMKYALALLDPGSQPLFQELADQGEIPAEYADRPAAWDNEDSRKYVVLMTDGQITEQFRPVYPLAALNWTQELQRQPSRNRTQITSRNQNLSDFYKACDQARENGVIVFTIAYQAPSNARTEMRNCASSPAHFFDVSGGDIRNAFSAIADQINQLRLIQ